MTDDDAALVRERTLAEHAGLLRTIADCAGAVAAGWDGEGTDDRAAVVPPLRATLERAGVLSRLPALLESAADALETSLPAEPVAAPPYVVVTSTGPVVRATVPGRGRLVVEVRVFSVERTGSGARYRLVDRVHAGSPDWLDGASSGRHVDEPSGRPDDGSSDRHVDTPTSRPEDDPPSQSDPDDLLRVTIR